VADIKSDTVAIGTVNGLDAEGLMVEGHPHRGKVIVTILCTDEQAHAWGKLWGVEVEACKARLGAGAGDPLSAIREAWRAYQRGYINQQEFEGAVAEWVEVRRG
jgi:hypothetical protein